METGEYHRPNDFPQTTELWIMDSIIDISPDGDRIIWWRTEIKDFTIQNNRFVNFNEFKSEPIISNIDFSDQQPYIGEDSPYVWLSNDIFIELKAHIVGTSLEAVDMFLVDLKNQTRNKFKKYHPNSSLGSGKISPDGKYVAFIGGLALLDWEQELGAIYILDLDTLEEDLELIQIPSKTIFTLQGSWSPDSSKFLYWGSYLDEATGNHYWGTHIIDLNTLKPRFVGMFYATWSADPEILLGFHQGKFVHLDLYGSVIREYPLPPSLNFDSLFRQPLPPFPDGSGFFIFTNIKDTNTYSLSVFDLSTENLREVAEFRNERYPYVEPSTDGMWLLFRTRYSEELGDAPMPSDRHASDYEWEETWYICNQLECMTFSPPGTDECDKVYWLGPYKFSDN